MMRSTLHAAVAGAVLSAALAWAIPVAAQVACPNQGMLGANPAVNGDHVFCGEINKKGRAVGFHSRPDGLDPATVSNTADTTPLAPVGVYEIRNFTITVGGTSRTKALSTMFPDHCSKDDVVAAIRTAAAGGTAGQRFRGSSGAACQAGSPPGSFFIVGYLDGSGDVITAWPDY